VGYVICRLKSSFRDWLVSEFPVSWGVAADAIVYPTKGDAERIRQRLVPIKTAVIDLGDGTPGSTSSEK
jgi:hypothetical protein